jgi:hypothetical protein
MAELRAGAGMEGPLRANLHEWGPFQIEVSMTERRFPPPWSSIPLRGVKLRQDSCPLKIRDAVVAWRKSNSSTSCLSFFFKTPNISCIVA